MIQIAIICVYLSLLLALGIFSSTLFKGTSKDYMLASHSIGPFLMLMSLFGTTMTAFALIGSTGEAYEQGIGIYGYLASSSGIVHSLCFFVIGVRVWKWGKKYGYSTQIQFFRDRLESDKIGLVLFPILVGLVVPYLLIGVIGAGTFINAVTAEAFVEQGWFAGADYGVPKWLGALVICGVVLVYVFFGGMRATAMANAFQTVIFMILGVVTFFIIADKLGGPSARATAAAEQGVSPEQVEDPGIVASMQAASQAVAEKHPSKLIRGNDPVEVETVEKSLALWKTLAAYEYAVANEGLSLTEEQIAAAREEFKPRMPGWERRAEAVYAKKNGLLPELSREQELLAEIRQDDRVEPASLADLKDPKGEYYEFEHFPRKPEPEIEAAALAKFKMKYRDPGTLTAEERASGDYWNRKRTIGIYKAGMWAPHMPHPIGVWDFITYMLIPLSVGMFPHLFQHWLTAKNANSFKLPVVAHPIFIAIVWAPCVMIGVWATSAILPGGAPAIPPHFNANAVLPKLVGDFSTAWLGGLLSAGVLAAIMSSLDSQFLCIGTIFTNDLVVHYRGEEKVSDSQRLWLARAFIIGVVALTYWFSLFEPARVFQLGVWTFSGFSSLFPLVFAACYWRGLSKAGAYACVLGAFASWLTLFYLSDFANIPNYTPFGIQPVLIMMICSIVPMVVVSLITPKPTAATLAKFFRTP